MWCPSFAALFLVAVWTWQPTCGQIRQVVTKTVTENFITLTDNRTVLPENFNQMDVIEEKLTTLATAMEALPSSAEMEKRLKGVTDEMTKTCKGPMDRPVPDDGYYLAFRLTAGIRKSGNDTYWDVGNNDDDHDIRHHLMPCGCKSTNGSLYCDRHYRSALLDLWPRLPVEKVKVSVYNDGVEKRRFVFDGRNSDSRSFFQQARLLQDPYVDLSAEVPSSPPLNHFSIAGDHQYSRSFFINNNYGGCSNDGGWLVVGDLRTDFPCPWEEQHQAKFPFILYADTAAPAVNGDEKYMKAVWQSGKVGKADVLTVSIKLREKEQCEL